MSTSQISVSALLAAVAMHLFIAARVALGGVAADGALLFGAPLGDALGQSFLLVAPPFALYGGVRAALRCRDDVLAYLAISGGGLLTILTGGGLIAIVLSS